MALGSNCKIGANSDLQITCIYDMDIVFEPNGVFNEVYLYVSSTTSTGVPAMTVNGRLLGRAYGSGSTCYCRSNRLVCERALSQCFEIRSGQPLSDAHFQVRSWCLFEVEIYMLIHLQSFMYQTLCGLKVRLSMKPPSSAIET